MGPMLSRNVAQECLDVGRIGFPETSVKDYNSTLVISEYSVDPIYFIAVTRTDYAWISIWEITQN